MIGMRLSDASIKELTKTAESFGFRLSESRPAELEYSSQGGQYKVFFDAEKFSVEADGSLSVNATNVSEVRFSEIVSAFDLRFTIPFTFADEADEPKAIQELQKFLTYLLSVMLPEFGVNAITQCVLDARSNRTAYYSNTGARARAQAAWEQHDFSQVIREYGQVIGPLSEIETKRVEFSYKKIEANR